MLTAEQLAKREGRLTASRVRCLMTSDKAQILSLWNMMIGAEPENVQINPWYDVLGGCTEPIHIDWLERQYGPISRRGDVVVHANGWAAATLDGWCEREACPVEAKHVGGYERRGVIRDRYKPQTHWQMLVTGTTRCLFSVIEGNREPRAEFTKLDDAYATELWHRASLFMLHVKNLTLPC